MVCRGVKMRYIYSPVDSQWYLINFQWILKYQDLITFCINAKCDDLENNMASLSNRLDTALAVLDTRDATITQLEDDIDDLGQYSRRSSLRIPGLGPFAPKENFRETVVSLAAEIDVNLSLSDIDRAHPTGRGNSQLIVKFTNYAARFNLYTNRRKLKQTRPGVYINEDLTPKRHSLLKKLLVLKKAKAITNAWSNDGRLFAWADGKKS
jgi:hypothetical protein